MYTRSCSFKALLIIFLTLLSHSLKMAASNPKHVAVLSEICLYNKVVLDQNLNIYYSALWGGLLHQTSPTWVKKYGKYG